MDIIIGIVAIVGWVAYFKKSYDYNQMESFVIRKFVKKEIA